MKDNLFEMLLNLFEKTLTQIKENHASTGTHNKEHDESVGAQGSTHASANLAFVQPAHHDSIRVFTREEQTKLTKASYQFLMRASLWDILSPEVFELIMNQLVFSESRFVSLQETKWTIRSTLANSLDAEQLAFLDLVLYHKEDQLALH